MSIDYDQLREWLATVERENPGSGGAIEFTYPGSTVEIIRELLRLRDGVGELVESKRDAAGLIHEHIKAGSLPGYLGYAAAGVEYMCDNITDILNGDVPNERTEAR